VKFSATTLSVLAIAVLTSGCTAKRLTKHLAEKEQQVEELIQSTADWTIRPTRTVGWTEAVRLMMENQLRLKQQRDAIRQARNEKKYLWRDLLPSFNLSTNVRQSVDQLAMIQPSQLGLAVNASMFASGLISYSGRHYALALQEVRAELNYEMAVRQETSRLLQHFEEYDRWKRNGDDLHREMELFQSYAAPGNIAQQVSRFRQREFQWNESGKRIRHQVSRHLGLSSESVELVTEFVPKFSYSDRIALESDDTRIVHGLGLLRRKLWATELEAARLRTLGAKLDRWPDIGLSVGLPPLMRLSGGDTDRFAVDDTALSANSRVRLDTTGRSSLRIEQAQDNEELLKQRIVEAVIDERFRIEQAVGSARELIAQRAQLQAQTEVVQASGTPVTARQVTESVRLIEQIGRRTEQIQDQLGRLSRDIWLLDDDAWKPYQVIAEEVLRSESIEHDSKSM
jgi:hypothetical protein